ncbi:MAG TPA: hypothetical protein VJK09_02255 [Candidatus Paceibacterota bacterium]
MEKRIFLGKAEGPSEEVSDEGELRDMEALRGIIRLLKSDPETQERFKKSGKTSKEFIADHVKYFGQHSVKNLTRLGFDTVMAEKAKRDKK